MRSHRSASFAAVVVTMAFMQACGGDSAGPEGGGATALTLTTSPSANAQNRVAFPTQPVVQLRRADGSPVARAGVAVTVAGGTLLGTTTVLTASDGSATFTNVAAAGAAGSRTLTFSATGLTSVQTTIALTAGTATTIAAHAGLGQWAAPNAAVPTPPSVVVTDIDGNPISGLSVSYAVTGGGGSITGASPVTDASGHATVGSWTLGSAPGPNTLSATATGLTGSPVVFTAAASTAGPPAGAAFSTGGAHTCGLSTAGAAYCWGRTEFGQIGVTTAPTICTIDGGDYPCSMSPILVQGGLTFTTISAGNEHTCALTSAGAAWCWGRNNAGQLGDNTTTNKFDDHQSAPSLVSGGLAFTSISAGGLHTCALTSAGAAYCWGANGSGQLGDGTQVNRPVPVAVGGALTFIAIETGTSTTCGLVAGGTAYCWGWNNWGQTGYGAADNLAHKTPQLVTGGLTFLSLSGSYAHTCGITSANAAYCWGFNAYGSLGDGTETPRPAPVAVVDGHSFFRVAAGGFSNVNAHSCGLEISGIAWCWGDNTASALGDGTIISKSVPSAVSSALSFTNIDAGYRHTCARAGTGDLYCWGSNRAGQLGLGHVNPILVPTRVNGIP